MPGMPTIVMGRRSHAGQVSVGESVHQDRRRAADVGGRADGRVQRHREEFMSRQRAEERAEGGTIA